MKKIAFLFPGQGSQTPGMGESFMGSPLAEETFQQANDALGYDLKKLCLEGPADELTLTQNAQPAILTVSTIAYRLFREKSDLVPAFAAGHSLGEYSALVAAGVLDFKDAVLSVHLRGKFMQAAVPVGEGTMAAILGMEPAEIAAICEEEAQGQVVSPANFNTKGQIVIAGHTEAVQRVLKRAKGMQLEVSAPFHCSLMKPAADQLGEHLKTISFSDAAFPIVNNAANDTLSAKDDFLPSLIAQVTSAVKWETGVRKMIDEGVEAFIEFGSGKVLAGMMKRIERKMKVYNVSDLASIDSVIAEIQEG